MTNGSDKQRLCPTFPTASVAYAQRPHQISIELLEAFNKMSSAYTYASQLAVVLSYARWSHASLRCAATRALPKYSRLAGR